MSARRPKLYTKIGQLTLKGILGRRPGDERPERRAMVELPLRLCRRRQCALLNLARFGVYRPGRSPALMICLDAADRRIASEVPFYGSRRMVFELNQAGHGINRQRVQS